MSLTFQEARDEILTIFKDAWDATGHEAYYEDIKKSRESGETAWAVVTLRHAGGGQATLNNAAGSSRFRRVGILTVQVFTAIGKGLQESYALAKVVADAFEGTATPGGVWFRNVRINEIGRDGKFFQNNVLIDFTYDEIK